MTIRDDVLRLRADQCNRLATMDDSNPFTMDRRIQVAGFIGELDAILAKNPKENAE